MGSCTSSITPWQLDTIVSNEAQFDSARLRYVGNAAFPTLLFELMRINEQIDAFLSLTQFRLSSQCDHFTLKVGDTTSDEMISPHEGLMRVRLAMSTTEKIIQALQRGEKVSILIDGFEETLDPERFSISFTHFLRDEGMFSKLFKETVR